MIYLGFSMRKQSKKYWQAYLAIGVLLLVAVLLG